jgi:hypothetical protein
MGTVTRIVASKDPNRSKYDALSRQAEILGAIRKDVWHRLGSIQGSGIDFRTLRNDWMKNRSFHPLAAKAWKETLRDVLDDIAIDDKVVKSRVKQDIVKRESDKTARIKLYRKLDGKEWKTDLDLCWKIRQHKKHGQTNVDYQTILACRVHSQFAGKDGNAWHKVPSYMRGAQLSIPLSSNVVLHSCLRLILEDGIVYVHPTIEQKEFSPSGDRILGVDKGYSEAFADSDGDFHGTRLGEVFIQGAKKRCRRDGANKVSHADRTIGLSAHKQGQYSGRSR